MTSRSSSHHTSNKDRRLLLCLFTSTSPQLRRPRCRHSTPFLSCSWTGASSICQYLSSRSALVMSLISTCTGLAHSNSPAVGSSPYSFFKSTHWPPVRHYSFPPRACSEQPWVWKLFPPRCGEARLQLSPDVFLTAQQPSWKWVSATISKTFSGQMTPCHAGLVDWACRRASSTLSDNFSCLDNSSLGLVGRIVCKSPLFSHSVKHVLCEGKWLSPWDWSTK